MVATSLVLAGLWLRPEGSKGDARRWLSYGALLGLALVESYIAGAALLLVIGIQIALAVELPSRRNLGLLLGGTAFVACLGLWPLLIRPYAASTWMHLGFSLGTGDFATDRRAIALGTWFSEIGMISLFFAAVGAAWGVVHRRLRWLLVPAVVFILLDVVYPAGSGHGLAQPSTIPIRLMALASLSMLAVTGVHTSLLALLTLRIPMARRLASLIVVFSATLVLMTVEDSSFVADRDAQRGAEVWTDEALSDVPPNSLVLVSSRALAWRFWAARVARDERPDLLIVPVSLLDRGSVAARLLQLEPALVPLIREVVLTGQPSEFALASLADVRPLYVEFDPKWDKRLIHHVVPDGLWLRFAPQALGRSDRKAGFKRGRRVFRRVLAATEFAGGQDLATRQLLMRSVKRQIYTLAALGDRQHVQLLLADLDQLDHQDAFGQEVRRRLERSRRGRINVAGMLAVP